VKTGFVALPRKRLIEVATGKGYKTEDKGAVDVSYGWTDRVPHPANMSHYDAWANDPEANIAFNVLTDIVAGVRYYTEMPEDEDENHPNKQTIDDYGETVNLDEDLQEIVMAMLQKGFCPVERLSNYDLKILPPETFYIWRNKKGHIYRYTQERARGDVIATWEESNWKSKLEKYESLYPKQEFKELMAFEANDPSPLDDIILFFHRRTTSWPYGKSLVEPIGDLLTERTQMNEDMPKAIHRWAYPIPVMQTSGSKAALQTACEDRDIDDWIFVGNVDEGEVRFDTINIDPQARFIPYIELIYYQICEGLHAPLLLYLKNATEASATVMMESVDRLVNGIQGYVKRRVERYLFEPQVGKPVPRLIWGQPKTGLEDITLTDVAAVMPYLKRNQQLDLLKQFGIQLPEPEEDPFEQQPKLQFQPFQKPQPQIPMEQVLDKLNDLGTALQIIQTNYQEKRIPLTQAMRLGGKAIEVHLKRIHGKDVAAYEERREVEFGKWTRRLLGVKESEGKVYKVSVGD